MGKEAGKLITVLSGLAITGYFLYKGFSKQSPEKYSLEWIKSLTNSQWETERKIVQEKYCSPEYSTSLKIDFKRILDLFDRVKSERDWGGRTPRGPSYSREHGYNLYKP